MRKSKAINPKAINQAVEILTPSPSPADIWPDMTVSYPQSTPIAPGRYILVPAERAESVVLALTSADGRTRTDPSKRAKRKPVAKGAKKVAKKAARRR